MKKSYRPKKLSIRDRHAEKKLYFCRKFCGEYVRYSPHRHIKACIFGNLTNGRLYAGNEVTDSAALTDSGMAGIPMEKMRVTKK